MKKIEKIYVETIKIALLITLGIVALLYIYGYENMYYYTVKFLQEVGVTLFLYSVIFPVVYSIKMITLFLTKREKYETKDEIKDFKRIFGTVISLIAIFILAQMTYPYV